MVKCIKQRLYKSKLVLNNPVNLRQTKLDKSKLVLNSPVNSRMEENFKQIKRNLKTYLFRDMYCYNIMVRIVGTVNLSSDIEGHQFFVDIDVVDQIA